MEDNSLKTVPLLLDITMTGSWFPCMNWLLYVLDGVALHFVYFLIREMIVTEDNSLELKVYPTETGRDFDKTVGKLSWHECVIYSSIF